MGVPKTKKDKEMYKVELEFSEERENPIHRGGGGGYRNVMELHNMSGLFMVTEPLPCGNSTVCCVLIFLQMHIRCKNYK